MVARYIEKQRHKHAENVQKQRYQGGHFGVLPDYFGNAAATPGREQALAAAKAAAKGKGKGKYKGKKSGKKGKGDGKKGKTKGKGGKDRKGPPGKGPENAWGQYWNPTWTKGGKGKGKGKKDGKKGKKGDGGKPRSQSRDNANPGPASARVCPFFVAGNCTNGDNCKLMHPTNLFNKKMMMAMEASLSYFKTARATPGPAETQQPKSPKSPRSPSGEPSPRKPKPPKATAQPKEKAAPAPKAPARRTRKRSKTPAAPAEGSEWANEWCYDPNCAGDCGLYHPTEEEAQSYAESQYWANYQDDWDNYDAEMAAYYETGAW